MTLTELVTRCQARFRDTGGYTFLAEEWEAYLNEVYLSVVASRPDWPFMQTKSTAITFAPSATSMSLPADAWRVSSVYNATGKYPLVQIDGPAQHIYLYPDPTASPGSPQHFRVFARTIELYPVPAESTDVVVEYSASPAELTGSDSPIFPIQYHQVLLHGALQHAYEDIGNLQQAKVHEGHRDRLVLAMQNDLFGPKHPEFPVLTDNFFG